MLLRRPSTLDGSTDGVERSTDEITAAPIPVATASASSRRNCARIDHVSRSLPGALTTAERSASGDLVLVLYDGAVSYRVCALLAAFTAALLAPHGAGATQPPPPTPDLSAPLIRAAVTPPTTLPTIWGCHPDRQPSPCPAPPAASAPPPIDCFYVYPSLTQAQGLNAPRHIERRGYHMLRWQSSRLGPRCRFFAPIYRQATPWLSIGASLATGQTRTSASLNLGYADVRGAWRDYLARDNSGRGVLLIGHSQGASMLIRLMQDELDRRAQLRGRLVGAFLIGGHVAVKRGQRVGGNFAHIPTCEQPAEYGCVVAYSAFARAPAGSALFGRLGPLNKVYGGPSGRPYVPACTNPAFLAGDGDRLRSDLPGVFTASCRNTTTTAALMVAATRAADLPAAEPWADWGLHNSEMALTTGSLERIAELQGSAWLADQTAAAPGRE